MLSVSYLYFLFTFLDSFDTSFLLSRVSLDHPESATNVLHFPLNPTRSLIRYFIYAHASSLHICHIRPIVMNVYSSEFSYFTGSLVIVSRSVFSECYILKTRLRSKMPREIIYGLKLLNIHCQKDISVDAAKERFASMKKTKINILTHVFWYILLKIIKI